MNTVRVAKMYTVLIGTLGVVGLFVSGHLFQIMNVDVALDVTRLVLAALLIYAAFVARSERLSGTMLMMVGWLYIAMAVAGLFNPTLGGLLPSGLTGFDIAFHLAAGGLAIGTAMVKTDAAAHHA